MRSGPSDSSRSGSRTSSGWSASAATTPIARPIRSESKNSRIALPTEPPPVAAWIITSVSAIPTGSFAPDSPSRIVPVRPAISWRPITENMIAGSVGASAAPSTPDVDHWNPSR